MKLDPKLFARDESKSNHAVAALVYPGCPLGKMCFGIATGFGGVPVNICEHLKDESTAETPNANCLADGWKEV